MPKTEGTYYTAQWLNLLWEGTNNYFAINFLSFFFAIVNSGVKSIFWIYLSKWRGVFGVPYSGFADFTLFGLHKWLFSYINRQHNLQYCPVQQRLGKVELSAIKHSGKKGYDYKIVIMVQPCAHLEFWARKWQF